MKPLFYSLILIALVFACKAELKNALNTSEEPLTVESEAKVVSWVGYKTFSFKLHEITTNFSKNYVINNIQELRSAANSVLYSMPNNLRNEIMNEKASELVKLTKELEAIAESGDENTIKEALASLVKAYSLLNNEINYVTSKESI